MGHRKELKTYFYTRDIAQNEARRRDTAEIYSRDMQPRYIAETCSRATPGVLRRISGAWRVGATGAGSPNHGRFECNPQVGDISPRYIAEM